MPETSPMNPRGYFVVIHEDNLTKYRDNRIDNEEDGRKLGSSSQNIMPGVYAIELASFGNFGKLERKFAETDQGTDCVEYGIQKRAEIAGKWGIPINELEIYRSNCGNIEKVE